MIKMSVLYPNQEGKEFNRDYFLTTYVPLAEQVWGKALIRTEIDFGLSGQGPGVPPLYRVILHLYFDSIETLQSAIGPQHQELTRLTANFTAIQPTIQVSTVITGKSQPEDTIEDTPSRTASYVALCRALSFMDHRADIKGPDSLAHLFLSDDGKKICENADFIKRGIAFTAPLYGTMVARTAFFDAKFKEAVGGGIRQIVMLGAGYDTRPYRFSSILNGSTIYEMDIGPTQNRKRAILHEAKIGIPPQVKYVNINFKNENIMDVLLKNNFDPTTPAIFLWEGVTYYLTETVFRNTIEIVKSLVPQGSSICFDYMTVQRESGTTSEPFKFWIPSKALIEYLVIQGFTIVDHLEPNDMEKRYLSMADGQAAEKAFSAYCFVHAMV